jgi:hypothetical protein
MTGYLPCEITGYNSDRLSIPDYSLDATNLIKYEIGVDGIVKHAFTFDYVPNGPTWTVSNCLFYKTYEIEVVLKSDRSTVTNSFVSFVEPIS